MFVTPLGIARYLYSSGVCALTQGPQGGQPMRNEVGLYSLRHWVPLDSLLHAVGGGVPNAPGRRAASQCVTKLVCIRYTVGHRSVTFIECHCEPMRTPACNPFLTGRCPIRYSSNIGSKTDKAQGRGTDPPVCEAEKPSPQKGEGFGLLPTPLATLKKGGLPI